MELLDVFDGYIDQCNTLIVMNSDHESVRYASRSSCFRYFLIGERQYSTTPNPRLPLHHHTLIGVYQRALRFTHLRARYRTNDQ